MLTLSKISKAHNIPTTHAHPQATPNSQTLTLNEHEIQQMLQSKQEAEALSQLTHDQMKLTAHRGCGPTTVFNADRASDYPAENSLNAIKQAFIEGADVIEIDIFKSRDAVLFLSHDNEIWKIAQGQDRAGQHLPNGETHSSYLISSKDAAELKKIIIGPAGETLPTLAEVSELMRNANRELNKYHYPKVALNVELKDGSAVPEIVRFYSNEFHAGKRTDMEDIIFCSFNHNALIQLKESFEAENISPIRIAPGIKTKQLFDATDIGKRYEVTQGAEYNEHKLSQLLKLVTEHDMEGFDAVLWDFRAPLVELAAQSGKAIHASTSDFRQFDAVPDFAQALLAMSKEVTTFFKCDGVSKARRALLSASINGIGIQMLYQRTPEGDEHYYLYHSRNEVSSKILEEGGVYPTPYSQLKRV